MEYCCYTMNVHVFTDLKEEQFNKFLKNVELQLIKKMVIEKPIQFENRYYFRFEKVEWDNIRIDRELTHFIKHKYAAVQAWYEQTPQEYTYYEIGGIECDSRKNDVHVIFPFKRHAQHHPMGCACEGRNIYGHLEFACLVHHIRLDSRAVSEVKIALARVCLLKLTLPASFEIDSIGEDEAGIVVEHRFVYNLLDEFLGVERCPIVDHFGCCRLVQVDDVNCSLITAFVDFDEVLYGMKVVVQPHCVCNTHIGRIVEMGENFHQLGVVIVKEVNGVILRADCVQDLLLRGVFCAIGQHGRGDMDAEGRDNRVLLFIRCVQAKKVDARLVLPGVKNLLFFCELQFQYRFRAGATGSKQRCNEDYEKEFGFHRTFAYYLTLYIVSRETTAMSHCPIQPAIPPYSVTRLPSQSYRN